ncbi:Piso0_001037 [Millerozyma farinosa CBS 7064]|uniref:Mitochondrial intermediate peptidase n=1 Tax=Pichia sorbitophila (strain ATCC MYA-4447 / BCRC 22081 / CBS 7064 / NBRC 10061 / NRRL Y-12695) TaxID=559304 RepID=G8YS77_PICSO|nr:Piso0_001037 [Millerozyma farinosa CBS 7064]CCE79000.1 Piso0_001037 [Millerozyma farinosa CBS 7064]
MRGSLNLLRKNVIGLSGLRSPKPNLYHSRYSSTVATSNGDVLKKVFDDDKYFRVFNNKGSKGDKGFGLFKNEMVDSPNGLLNFSKDSLSKAKMVVKEMNSAFEEGPSGKLTYIRRLDQLSDILCRTIDLAEFIRVTHPNQKWVDAAQQTHEIMFEYMNQLNTNVELYRNLRDILEDKEIASKLEEEELKVGEYLLFDFERSGIHMDPQSRDNFVSITQQISLLGSSFCNQLSELDAYWCTISKHDFDKIDSPELKSEIENAQSLLPKELKKGKFTVCIPLVGVLPYTILQSCSVESIRREVWIKLHSSSKDQIDTLNAILKYRAILARMMGYKSFAHYQLEHKIAKTPENVFTFLNNIQSKMLSKEKGVFDELRQLYQSKPDKKENATDEDIINEIKPWDRDYLLDRTYKGLDNGDSDEIRNYLSVGTIMSGLDKLFTKLYNVSLRPVSTVPGETWDATQVRKICVIDLSTDKKLGYLYVDFWSPKVLPSHFTIVCSRELNSDIGTESAEDMRKLVQLDESAEAQLPVIALVCNFHKKSGSIFSSITSRGASKDATLLSLEQVDTIFHEMGHAMHSMIGRTKLHNLSGTRCSTDFVELPSVLMEFFSRDPRVLCDIARHIHTDEPLPEDLLARHQAHRTVLHECEAFMQSKMAMLDQVLHGEEIMTNRIDEFDSTVSYHNLESKLQLFADKWSTWHGKFPHLYSYGAVYYSYLLDRAIADKVWRVLFKNDPWSNAAGSKYKDSILQWGGTKDPWVCLAAALDNDLLAKGDFKAMEIIVNEESES